MEGEEESSESRVERRSSCTTGRSCRPSRTLQAECTANESAGKASRTAGNQSRVKKRGRKGDDLTV